KENGKLILSYRWEAEVVNFRMPVRIRTAENDWQWLQPTSEWQSTTLGEYDKDAFQVDTTHMYIATDEM
ncbi:MAG: hypothetical protein BRD50_02540, partial [Bacteroidetes bacterium SW_11_45_7]